MVQPYLLCLFNKPNALSTWRWESHLPGKAMYSYHETCRHHTTRITTRIPHSQNQKHTASKGAASKGAASKRAASKGASRGSLFLSGVRQRGAASTYLWLAPARALKDGNRLLRLRAARRRSEGRRRRRKVSKRERVSGRRCVEARTAGGTSSCPMRYACRPRLHP